MRRLALIVLLAALPLAAAAKGPRTRTRSPARRPTPAAPSSPAPATAETAYDDRTDDGAPALAEATPPDAGARPAPARNPPAPKSAPPAADNEAPEGKESAPPAAGPSPDLQRLRADYDRLRDELYRARARAQIVQEGLYPSRLSATLRWKGAPDHVIRRAELRLDGASVWDSGDKPVADDLIKVSERPIKPGPHALTVRLEIRPGTKTGKAAQNAEQLGYVSEHTFAILVPAGKRTNVAITGDEDGDAPEYQPEIEVELETEK